MSDSPNVCSGYGTVTRNLLDGLTKNTGHEWLALGWQYVGQPTRWGNFMMLPRGQRAFGEDILPYHLQQFKPDVLIVLADLFMVNYLAAMDFKDTKLVNYFPADGFPLPTGGANVLMKNTQAVAMSKFGKEVAKKEGIETEVIYHGVDSNVFSPVKDKEQLKRNLGLEGKFVIGFAGRNQERKKISRLLKAWKIFSTGKKDVHLILHTDPFDPEGPALLDRKGPGGQKLEGLISVLGAENVSFTHMPSFQLGLPLDHLNRIYNLFDIHVSATLGEGFGLTTLESMACGVPNILPDNTTAKELIGGRGELAKIQAWVTANNNVEMGLVDVEDMAAKMNYLYENEDVRGKYSKNGRKFAEEMDWKNIVPQWEKLLAKL
ncbi:MAG: glycosyltransferase family 4 protein [Candidatus Diapherotrites archaeon]